MEPTDNEEVEEIATGFDTTELLVDLLRGAEQAHGAYEKTLGRRDDDWPQWYAAHMTSALREAGYRVIREH